MDGMRRSAAETGQSGERLLTSRRVARDQYNAGTHCRQALCGDLADAGCRTGNDYDLALHTLRPCKAKRTLAGSAASRNHRLMAAPARHKSRRMVRGSSFWISLPFEMVSSEGLTIHSPICS